jgi:hypothetical protein
MYLASRYDSTIPIRFLAPIDYSKSPALEVKFTICQVYTIPALI